VKFLKHKTKGVLTVEAAIVFPIFILFFAFILNLLNIYYANTLMQNAINNITKKLSEVTYLYYIADKELVFTTAIYEKSLKTEEIEGAGADFAASFKDVVDAIIPQKEDKDLYLYLKKLSTLPDKGKIFAKNTKTLKEHFTDGFPVNMLGLVFSEQIDESSDNLMKILIKSYLHDMGYKTDKYIEIIDADLKLPGKFNKDITLTVIYNYKNTLSLKLLDKLTMVNSSTVHPWIGSDFKSVTESSNKSSEGD
jgi:hypothetical protein